jgi:hypothetical protein
VDKKPLIVVSLCAVVLLVLASLGNVVGYQSVKSTVNDSPLFRIRTQKATNQDDKELLTSGYLGKGRNIIQIPMPEDRTISYQKVIDRFKNMDDKTFFDFIRKILQMKNQNAQLRDIDETTIITSLNQLRKQDIDFTQYQDGLDDNKFPQRMIGNFTLFITPTVCWFPGCLIFKFIYISLAVIGGLILMIYFTIAYPEDCNPPTSMTMCCN